MQITKSRINQNILVDGVVVGKELEILPISFERKFIAAREGFVTPEEAEALIAKGKRVVGAYLWKVQIAQGEATMLVSRPGTPFIRDYELEIGVRCMLRVALISIEELVFGQWVFEKL